jgi:hypothetical protein
LLTNQEAPEDHDSVIRRGEEFLTTKTQS